MLVDKLTLIDVSQQPPTFLGNIEGRYFDMSLKRCHVFVHKPLGNLEIYTYDVGSTSDSVFFGDIDLQGKTLLGTDDFLLSADDGSLTVINYF